MTRFRAAITALLALAACDGEPDHPWCSQPRPLAEAGDWSLAEAEEACEADAADTGLPSCWSGSCGVSYAWFGFLDLSGTETWYFGSDGEPAAARRCEDYAVACPGDELVHCVVYGTRPPGCGR